MLDRDAHIVEVCGNFSVATSTTLARKTYTIHAAADAAGLLPICHPVGQEPLQSPFQSKDQPPSPFPLSVFPPPRWFQQVPHPSVVRLWVCVTHLYAAVGYSRCFGGWSPVPRCSSDTSVNPDHKSFGKKFLDIFVVSITPASTVSVSSSCDWRDISHFSIR